MTPSLRAAVLKTHGLWLFKQGYEAIYRLAIACFLRNVARSGLTARSVYMRRSHAAHVQVPGLSDIDLTVILAAPRPHAVEYPLLDRFWAAHRRLKAFFPMLGEVEILDAVEFGPWLADTVFHPGPRSWLLVQGQPHSDLAIPAAPAWTERALRMAWWIYEDLLPPCLAQPDSFVRTRDLRRRMEKIFRLLSPILREAGQTLAAIPANCEPAEMVAALIRILDQAARCVVSIGTRSYLNHGAPVLFRSLFDSGQMLILDGDPDLNTIRQNLGRDQDGIPLMISPVLLEYRIRFWDPYDYAMLRHEWAAGPEDHPLEKIQPPEEPEFLAFLRDRARNLQVAARGEELFSAEPPLEQIEKALWVDAAIKGIQEGQLLRSRNQVRDRWPVEFPDCKQALEKTSELIRLQASAQARGEAFVLYRTIVNRILASIENPDRQPGPLARVNSR